MAQALCAAEGGTMKLRVLILGYIEKVHAMATWLHAHQDVRIWSCSQFPPTYRGGRNSIF